MVEGERGTSSRGGRPAVTFSVNPRGAYLAVFDVSRHEHRSLLCDISGTVWAGSVEEIDEAATTAKIYSFPSPTAGATFSVFYNRAVSEKAGVRVPASLDELTAAMGKLKAAGVTPLYLAGKDGWTLLQHRNSANALMNLSGDTIAKLTRTRCAGTPFPS